MDAHEAINEALAGLSCPYSREPAEERPETYVAWFEVLARPIMHASNGPRRVDHLMQVDIYSQQPTDDLCKDVRRKLSQGGLLIESWGPEDYEQDTKYRHLPIICRWHSKED